MEQRLKRDPYGFVGTVLADRYKIEELIGIGGMGAVYRAQHQVTTATVALKVLKPDLALSNPEMVEAFLKEAKATSSLDHPYIIKVTDAAVTADGIPFLTMEWLEGQTVEAEMKEKGVLPLEQTATLLEQIGEALAQAHAKGIVHRDLKPGNMMIVTDYRGDPVVKILDFGIAKALSSTTGAKVSRAMGTLHYASPEQLQLGSAIDHRSDIYSLGIILFQLITGQVPFDSDSMERMILQHLKTPPPSLRQARPEIPEAVETVVHKAMAKSPDERFQSAVELARAFRQAISLEAAVFVVQCLDASTKSPLAGAFVYLDSKYAGQTDDRGRWRKDDLLPKQHRIEIECLQYQSWKTSVRLDPRKETTVTVELAQVQVGELTLVCGVPGAEVIVDDKRVGVTDAAGKLYLDQVAHGKHKVTIAHPQRQTAVSEIEVVQGQLTSLNLELPPVSRRPFNTVVQGIKSLTVGLLEKGNVKETIGVEKAPVGETQTTNPGDSPTAVLEQAPTVQVTQNPTQAVAPRKRFALVAVTSVVIVAAGLATFLYVRRDSQPPPPVPEAPPIAQALPTAPEPVPVASSETQPPPIVEEKTAAVTQPPPAPGKKPTTTNPPALKPTPNKPGQQQVPMESAARGSSSPVSSPAPTPPPTPAPAAPAMTFEEHKNRGIANFNAKRYQAALDEYRQAQRLDPANKDVYYLIGMVYEQTGNLDAAIDAFRQCTAGPYVSVARNHLKTLEKKKGKSK
jgi:serine/threonine protein kinase